MTGWPRVEELKPPKGREADWAATNPPFRCPQCKNPHRASSLAHTYRYCAVCQAQYTDPTGTIPHCAWKPSWQLPSRPGTGFIWIRSASVGHHLDPARAVDATDVLMRRLRENGYQKLQLDCQADVASLFPESRLPNGLSWDDEEPKDLRVRYEVVVNGTAAGSFGYSYLGFARIPLHRVATASYDRSKDRAHRGGAVTRGTAVIRLIRPLLVLARDSPPATRITRARWGVLGPHYCQTFAAYDVTEDLQFMVDETGGMCEVCGGSRWKCVWSDCLTPSSRRRRRSTTRRRRRRCRCGRRRHACRRRRCRLPAAAAGPHACRPRF